MKPYSLIIALLLLTGCFPRGEGKMPSESAALAIRMDAVKYIESHSNNKESQPELPSAIAKLKPLQVDHYGGGVLLIFQRRFVEAYGYYYCEGTNQLPSELTNYCEKISTGIYRYYDGG